MIVPLSVHFVGNRDSSIPDDYSISLMQGLYPIETYHAESIYMNDTHPWIIRWKIIYDMIDTLSRASDMDEFNRGKQLIYSYDLQIRESCDSTYEVYILYASISDDYPFNIISYRYEKL